MKQWAEKLVREAHRRTLWQVLGIYLAGSWIALQIVDILADNIGLPDWVFPFALVLLIIGLPIVLATAFVQEGMPGKDDLRSAGRPRSDWSPAGRESGAPGPGDYSIGDRPKRSSARSGVGGGSRSDRGREASRIDQAGDDEAGDDRTWDVAAASASAPDAKSSPRASTVGGLFTWRNAIGGGVLALLLLLVVTTGFMFMRSRGLGPAGTLVAKGVIDERAPILVADFHSANEPGLARMVTEAFRVDFAQTDVVRLVEAARVADALRRMERDPAQPLDEDLALLVARRDGIPAIVSGTVGRIGGGYVLTARILAAADGRVLASQRETAADSTEILGAIDELSGDLRTRIGESFASVRADVPLERVTTASLPALELYSRAIQEIEYEADRESGIRLLEQALEEDPEFASAWRKLGVVLSNMRQAPARIEEAITRAYELRDRLTPRERHLAEASYAGTVLGDRQRAIAAYERMLSDDPDDPWALNNVAILYSDEGDDDRALALMERAVAFDTSAISFGNVVWHRLEVGDVQGADSVAEVFARKYPDDTRAVEAPAILAVHRDDYGAAEAHFRRALPEVKGESEIMALAGLAAVLETTGRLSEAAATDERAARVASALGFPTAELRPLRDRFWRELQVRADTAAAGRALRALEEFEGLQSLDPRDRPYAGLALANAALGEREDAERYLASFRESRPEAGDARFRDEETEVMATLALTDGRWEEAIDAFHQYRRLEGEGCDCALYRLGIAHEGAGRPDSAIAYFERAIDVRGPDRLWSRSGTLGPALERIARLHDEQGRLEQAAAYYVEFAELWEDADADLRPRVEAARARAEEIIRDRG